jgi:hypothetical protein
MVQSQTLKEVFEPENSGNNWENGVSAQYSLLISNPINFCGFDYVTSTWFCL